MDGRGVRDRTGGSSPHRRSLGDVGFKSVDIPPRSLSRRTSDWVLVVGGLLRPVCLETHVGPTPSPRVDPGRSLGSVWAHVRDEGLRVSTQSRDSGDGRGVRTPRPTS